MLVPPLREPNIHAFVYLLACLSLSRFSHMMKTLGKSPLSEENKYPLLHVLNLSAHVALVHEKLVSFH